MTPYLFTKYPPLLTKKGSKQLIPAKEYGGLSAVTLLSGKSAIFSFPGFPHQRLQSKKLLIIQRTDVLAFMIQSFYRMCAKIFYDVDIHIMISKTYQSVQIADENIEL